MDYSKITLGELLSSQDDIIKRNAISILKRYQRNNEEKIYFCTRHEDKYTERHKITGEYMCRACIIEKDSFSPLN